MRQDFADIIEYPNTLKQISAVSNIIDIDRQNNPQLCFTITFQNGTILNIFQNYSALDRSQCYQEIAALHHKVLDNMAPASPQIESIEKEELDIDVSGTNNITVEHRR
ncbi:MAG: hypothetical protein CVU48_08665 [Candidatus Cloacimonetes bacterium HGW-Cloacimonetes-1]|nr:MAG: hypothetical protein CVU48_08665 [Candidatus Cloacimonetes bacterium HGW-Cloacimonetes-1]